jgi:hypothetical protein
LKWLVARSLSVGTKELARLRGRDEVHDDLKGTSKRRSDQP